jgi:TolB-like protein
MKKALFTLLLAATAMAAAWAQPKVAVLDAIIPQNMDPSIITPSTDKIIEKLVQSNRFTVLDRANIESVLKEREFQVSGMVSDQDAVTAGKYLGADFIVVAKISKVGDTNFVSGRMINVKTGVIVSSTSAQGDGKLAVVVGLAGQVGDVLAGGVAAPEPKVAVTPPPAAEETTVPVTPPAPAEETVAPPSAERRRPASSFIGGGLVFSGDTYTFTAESSMYGDYEYEEKTNFIGYGVNFTTKFVQFYIGLSNFTTGTISEDNQVTGTSGSADIDVTLTYMTLGMQFRLPIPMGTAAFVPLAGFEYDLNLELKDSSGNDLTTGMDSDQKANLNHFYFQIGAGFQFSIGRVVVYPQLLYGWKFKSQYNKDAEKAYEDLGFDSAKVKEGKLDFGIIVGFKLS